MCHRYPSRAPLSAKGYLSHPQATLLHLKSIYIWPKVWELSVRRRERRRGPSLNFPLCHLIFPSSFYQVLSGTPAGDCPGRYKKIPRGSSINLSHRARSPYHPQSALPNPCHAPSYFYPHQRPACRCQAGQRIEIKRSYFKIIIASA